MILGKYNKKMIGLLLIISAVNLSVANQCQLLGIDLKSSSHSLKLQLNFANTDSPLMYEANIEPNAEYYILSYSIPKCISKVTSLPDIEYPIMHAEIKRPPKTPNNNLIVNFYLKSKPPITHTNFQNSIVSKLTVSEVFPDEAPVVLETFSSQSEASNTITLKFQFSAMPSTKQGFLSKDKKTVIFLFSNTALGAKMVRPAQKFVSQFKVRDGATFGGVPYTKVAISSEDPLFFTDSPEANTYVVELFGQGRDENKPSPPVKAARYVPKEGNAGIDAEAYERSQSSYAAGNAAKTILYWGLGSAVLIGGGYYGYKEYTKKGPEPPPEVKPIPQPSEVTIFPSE